MGWLDGEVALITGGGSGIGRAVVDRFIEEGARVGVVDVVKDRLTELADTYKDNITCIQGDVTRVVSFLLSREQSARAYPQVGVSTAHHTISHHGGDREKIAQKAKIDAFHVKLLTYYVDKLKHTPDGDGSLLDHVAVVYGAGLGEPNTHEAFDRSQERRRGRAEREVVAG